MVGHIDENVYLIYEKVILEIYRHTHVMELTVKIRMNHAL